MKRTVLLVACAAGCIVLPGCGLFDIYDCKIRVFKVVPARPPEPERLRVINFNVLHGYPDFSNQKERYEKTLQAFRKLQPDVLILQEVWRTWLNGDLAENLALELGMDMAYGRANGFLPFLGFEEGSAILSRYPILEAERVLLLPRKPFWESRIALVVTLSLGKDKTMTVVGTHLTNHSLATCRRQAEFLRERVSHLGPVAMVAGDFNSVSGSLVLDTFTEREMVDVIPGGIDHILVDEKCFDDWRIADSRQTLRPQDMLGLIGKASRVSDHPGLMIDLVRCSEESALARADQ